MALPTIAAGTAGRWNGSFASGRARLICGMIAMASSKRAGPRSNGLSTVLARLALALRRDLSCAVLRADRAGPGLGPVDEHAVGERHAAEPELLIAHWIEVIDSESNSANRAVLRPASPEPRAS